MADAPQILISDQLKANSLARTIAALEPFKGPLTPAELIVNRLITMALGCTYRASEPEPVEA